VPWETCTPILIFLCFFVVFKLRARTGQMDRRTDRRMYIIVNQTNAAAPYEESPKKCTIVCWTQRSWQSIPSWVRGRSTGKDLWTSTMVDSDVTVYFYNVNGVCLASQTAKPSLRSYCQSRPKSFGHEMTHQKRCTQFPSHCGPFASNLEQVANLRCAQVNSASYTSRDGKWVVAFGLRGEWLV